MKALILAAGRGSRIEGLTNKGPKPLLRLLGLSLLERAILTVKIAGIREVFIVTGFKAEEIEKAIGDGSALNVKISYIHNPNWPKGNGTSLLAAKNHIKGKFILLMADHIFDPDIIKDLKRQSLKDAVAIVAGDPSPKTYIDLEDATKIVAEDSRVLTIGKKINNFTHIDCGAFLVDDSIFQYCEHIHKEELSLNDIMAELASKGKLKLREIKEKFWIDVDTPEAYKMAEELLCKSLIKPTDGFISRVLNRPISLRISKRLVNSNISPNTITLISFGISLLSAVLLAMGSYIMTLIGGILVQINSIVDGCDGEVARLKLRATEYGAWLDAVLDRYSDAFILLGATVGLYKYGIWGTELWLWSYTALMGSLINSYTATKYDAIIKKTHKPHGGLAGIPECF